MSDASTTGTVLPVPGAIAPARGDRWFRKRMLALLEQLQGCEISIEEGATRLVVGRALPGEEPLRCTVIVNDPAMYRMVALGGSVGVGEAYMDGLWDCSDVTALVRNREFGGKHKITGTPTLLFTDGTRVPGAIAPERVEKLLAAAK